MPKRTLLLITLLVGITFVLLFLAFNSTPSSQQSAEPHITAAPTKIQTTTLSFNPPLLSAKSRPYTTTIMIDTGESSITGVEIVLLYNKTLIQNVKITPAENNFFGTTTNFSLLKNAVDEANGKATLIIGLPIGGHPQKGSGALAHVTFTPSAAKTSGTTSVSFTADTKVTIDPSIQETSVLKAALPFTYSFSSQ